MDKKNKKKSSLHPFNTWPPPRKTDEDEVKDPRREKLLKPRNKSYVDRFEEMEAELNAPVFEGDEAEQIEKKQEEIEKKEDRDSTKKY